MNNNNNENDLIRELEEKFDELFGSIDDYGDDIDFDDELEDLDNIIVLNDENGNEITFEFLDLIEYEGEEYVVLLPTDDSAEEVVILKVDDPDDSDLEGYVSVDDEATLQAVFEIFKDRFKDVFKICFLNLKRGGKHMSKYFSNDIINSGYFLISDASDHVIEFHEIQFFQNEQELLEYIKNEYTATDAEEVTKYSLDELMEGQVYKIGHRQGTHQSEVKIVLVHSTNLNILFNALKKVEIEDEDGENVNLSTYMRDARSSEDIQEIIDIYNESFDCYW